MLKRIDIRVWLLLLFTAILSVVDIGGYYISHAAPWWQLAGLICFAILKATVATALGTIWPFMCRSARPTGPGSPYGVWRIIHILLVILVSVAAILSVVNGLSYFLYGFGISRKMVIIITETNSQEVREFIPWLLDSLRNSKPAMAILLSGAVVACIGIYHKFIRRKTALHTERSFREKSHPLQSIWVVFTLSTSMAGLLYGACFMLSAPWGKVNHFPIGRTLASAYSVAENMERVKELSEKTRPLPHSELAKSRNLADKVVVVIGESASKGHWSAYGYPLPTTPVIDSLLQSSGDLATFLFTGAAASSTATSGNLPRILTFMSDKPDAGEWYDYPTLLQLFKAYGYTTTWLSNQEKSGKWSNLSGILSSDADVVRYLGSIDSEDHLTERYDDILIPDFHQTYSSPDSLQLICLHLLGSHTEYDKRYPPERSRFTSDDILSIPETSLPKREWLNKRKARTVAEYDNSILFTDSILGLVIKEIERDTLPAVMVYLSDHGENVYDDRDFRGRDVNFTDVPFIIVANKAYTERNPEIMQQLASSSHHSFSTSSTIYMLITLVGGSYPMYDEREDPLSEGFMERPVFRDN